MTYKYYTRASTVVSWTLFDLGFTVKNMIVASSPENTEDIKYSFDGGTTTDGEIAPGEPLTFNGIEARYIWIKSTSGGMEYRLWAWC